MELTQVSWYLSLLLLLPDGSYAAPDKNALFITKASFDALYPTCPDLPELDRNEIKFPDWQHYSYLKSYNYTFQLDCKTTCSELYVNERDFIRVKSKLKKLVYTKRAKFRLGFNTNDGEVLDKELVVSRILEKLQSCFTQQMKLAEIDMHKQECDCYFTNIYTKYCHTVGYSFVFLGFFFCSRRLKSKGKVKGTRKGSYVSSIVVDNEGEEVTRNLDF